MSGSARSRLALLAMADALGGKQGLDRRRFFQSAAGMAASFVAMNEVYGPLWRDKGFAEDHEIGADVPGFSHPVCKPGDRRFAIQKNRRCLHRRRAKAGVDVTHHVGSLH